MNAMASQIAGISTVSSTVCLGKHQRKHQSSMSLAIVRGIYHHKASNAEMFPLDYAIMYVFMKCTSVLRGQYPSIFHLI